MAGRSEAHHQFEAELVLLALEGDAAVAVEVLLVVQADVRQKGFVDAEGDAAGDALAGVVRRDGATVVAESQAIPVVVHHVVARQERYLVEEAAGGDVVVDEGVEGIDVAEGVAGVVLVEVFGLDVPAAPLDVGPDVEHVRGRSGGLYLLYAERDVPHLEREYLHLGRVVHLLVPRLLFGES